MNTFVNHRARLLQPAVSAFTMELRDMMTVREQDRRINYSVAPDSFKLHPASAIYCYENQRALSGSLDSRPMALKFCFRWWCHLQLWALNDDVTFRKDLDDDVTFKRVLDDDITFRRALEDDVTFRWALDDHVIFRRGLDDNCAFKIAYDNVTTFILDIKKNVLTLSCWKLILSVYKMFKHFITVYHSIWKNCFLLS